MWLVLPTRRYLLLTGGKAYLREASSPWARSACEVTICAEDQVSEALARLPKTRLRPRLELILGSALCRFVVMERPLGIRSDGDSLAVLQAHAGKRLGLREAEWSFVTDNRRRRQILGCAVRKATIAKIEAWGSASNHRVGSIRPLLAEEAFGSVSGTRNRKAARGWAVIEEDAVCAIDLTDTQLRLASSRATSIGAADAAERMLLGLGDGRALQTFVFAPEKSRRLRTDFRDLFEEAATP